MNPTRRAKPLDPRVEHWVKWRGVGQIVGFGFAGEWRIPNFDGRMARLTILDNDRFPALTEA